MSAVLFLNRIKYNFCEYENVGHLVIFNFKTRNKIVDDQKLNLKKIIFLLPLKIFNLFFFLIVVH